MIVLPPDLLRSLVSEVSVPPSSPPETPCIGADPPGDVSPTPVPLAVHQHLRALEDTAWTLAEEADRVRAEIAALETRIARGRALIATRLQSGQEVPPSWTQLLATLCDQRAALHHRLAQTVVRQVLAEEAFRQALIDYERRHAPEESPEKGAR